MVIAPEHPLVSKLTTADNTDVVKTYIEQAKRQTDIQRESVDREKTGVFSGSYAINPVNQSRIPIWIADYVLMGYGYRRDHGSPPLMISGILNLPGSLISM